MDRYLRFPMISGEGATIDSAIIFWDIEPENDFGIGIVYYVKDPSIHCKFVN